jgi:hypothetical protein
VEPASEPEPESVSAAGPPPSSFVADAASLDAFEEHAADTPASAHVAMTARRNCLDGLGFTMDLRLPGVLGLQPSKAEGVPHDEGAEQRRQSRDAGAMARATSREHS